MNALIKKFNKPETFLIISDYPEQSRYGEKNYGIAWYTKTLLEPLTKKYGVRFVVLAEKTQLYTKPELHANGKILVLRVFDPTQHSLYPTILRYLLMFTNIKKVQIHSEFCTNGGMKNFMLLLPFLLLIKATGKDITYFAHNVVTKLNAIAPHLGMKKNSLKVKTLDFLLPIYYRMLGLVVKDFVTMDSVIQERLSQFVNKKRVLLHPFGIVNRHSGKRSASRIDSGQARMTARKALKIKKDEFVLLYFGFITYYKGADWIIQTVKQLQKQKKYKHIKLVLAGGEAYSLKDKPYYQKFYKKLLRDTNCHPERSEGSHSIKRNTGDSSSRLQRTQNDKRIVITGFVPEKQMSTYFEASDLVVFPYRGIIGSSACLSHALAFRKPFIMSSGMSVVLNNVQTYLQNNDLTNKDLVFDHTIASFKRVLDNAMQIETRKKLTQFSADVAESRDADMLLQKCYTQIYAAGIKVQKKQITFGNVFLLPLFPQQNNVTS